MLLSVLTFVNKTIFNQSFLILYPTHFFLCAFRKNKGPPGVDDAEDKCENIITIENGIPCDPLDTKEGHINDGFSTEDERLTPLWEW